MDDLYTVNVFRVINNKNGQEYGDNGKQDSQQQPSSLTEDLNLIEKHHNMISAKVIRGRTIELEHSNIAGPAVKFKTVVNFDRTLSSDTSLGVVLVPQDGYINMTSPRD